jgi:hypothetical protein
MKLAALCCTYLRPQMLGELIECFQRQDYPLAERELVILDDAGQYDCQQGPGWRLISIPNRFHTLGEKRNACAALASRDVEGFLLADDDDIYLPHWFRAQAEALRRADWSRPSLVLSEHDGILREHPTHGMYHASWGLRREMFYRVRGYCAVSNGEDQELAHRLRAAGATQCDPCAFAPPFFLCRFNTGSYHLSVMDDGGYDKLGQRAAQGKAELGVGWSKAFDQLPIQRRGRDSRAVDASPRRVELIGPVNGPGGDGPSNGMHALQVALRRRMSKDLDWFGIERSPTSSDVLPWFWSWHHRRDAIAWNHEGLPFAMGPNVLFMYSRQPRIDQEECDLLDAEHCRAMFCHSAWYRDLIAQHRGPLNQSVISQWSYPIDEWPDEPLPDEYDLLIFVKNGHQPQLAEHLAQAFPRHVRLDYGKYKRRELAEAARRARACAYLADDDQGPLALEELLLAGCPTVGVRTAATYVETGINGCLVDRLPPGESGLETDDDRRALQLFMTAIERSQQINRMHVRELAAREFATDHCVDKLVAALDRARSSFAVEAAIV